MPLYKVFATHQPEVALEVDDTELVDLARQGLLVLGKGDINDRGRLKRGRDELPTTTGSLPAITTDTHTEGA